MLNQIKKKFFGGIIKSNIKRFKKKVSSVKINGLNKATSNFALPLILVLIALIIAFKNYSPDTFLSGWDTLHPEFDYKLNLIRTRSGVFRTEQGLGALASHAHMVEVVRIFILWF